MNAPKAGAPSPWDKIQRALEVAPGIVFVSTAGHGGYWISSARRQSMPAAIRQIETFAGGNWYEEDCDWSLIVLAFPDLFPPAACDAAIRMAKHHHLDADMPSVRACAQRAELAGCPA